jgi:hypothetical protein
MEHLRQPKLSRRTFLLFSAAFVGSSALPGCKKKYQRVDMEHDLGPVYSLIYPEQFIRERAILVIRDGAGWAAMSTRCVKEGCELSYQDQTFLCLCCSSIYDHAGRVLRGTATGRLPYFKVSYRDEHLFADSANVVSYTERFTTPELETAFRRVRERALEEHARTGEKIPDALLGGREYGEEGKKMFEEKRDIVVPDVEPPAEDSPSPSPSPTSIFQLPE